MGAENIILVVFGVATAGFGAALIGAARRSRRMAEQVAKDIEPYLRRKAAEAGLSDSVPVWTVHTTPEDIIAFSSDLAGRLLAREKGHPIETSSAALAQTVRAPEVNVEPGSTTAPQSPRARSDS